MLQFCFNVKNVDAQYTIYQLKAFYEMAALEATNSTCIKVHCPTINKIISAYTFSDNF